MKKDANKDILIRHAKTSRRDFKLMIAVSLLTGKNRTLEEFILDTKNELRLLPKNLRDEMLKIICGEKSRF